MSEETEAALRAEIECLTRARDKKLDAPELNDICDKLGKALGVTMNERNELRAEIKNLKHDLDEARELLKQARENSIDIAYVADYTSWETLAPNHMVHIYPSIHAGGSYVPVNYFRNALRMVKTIEKALK